MAKVIRPDLPVHLTRRFQTWRYGVGHGLLALRSPKPEYETNVDVVFHAVRLMLLADHYDTLLLRSATEDEFGWIRTLTDQQPAGAGEVIVIGESELRGFVWCTGGWWVDENDRDYLDPPEAFELPPAP